MNNAREAGKSPSDSINSHHPEADMSLGPVPSRSVPGLRAGADLIAVTRSRRDSTRIRGAAAGAAEPGMTDHTTSARVSEPGANPD